MNRRSLLRCAFLLVVYGGATYQLLAQGVSSDIRPRWTVELKSYGWAPPKSESDKVFFKDFTLKKLNALDTKTRVVFVSDDVLVVYHTKEQGQDWRAADRQLEAFVFRASDGSLLANKRWQTRMRTDISDLRDSEARLIPLSGDRFLVVANGRLLLYSSGLALMKEHDLAPFSSTDTWAVLQVPEGQKIFLRHESGSRQLTSYAWLDSETFREIYGLQGYSGSNFSVIVVPGDRAVFGWCGPNVQGICMSDKAQTNKKICDDTFCREDGTVAALFADMIGFSGETGIRVMNIDQGSLWSNRIMPKYRHEFQFGEIKPSITGKGFALWATANRKTVFDDMKLSNSPTLFVYDTTSPRHLLAVRLKQRGDSGDFDFALSPSGRSFAVFDGAQINLYQVH